VIPAPGQVGVVDFAPGQDRSRPQFEGLCQPGRRRRW
jgi:hypothetical protein